RGMSLAAPGEFRTTRRIEARLELLPAAPKLKQRSRVHFHAGTSETIAEIFLYGTSELAPGQSAFAHLHLQDDVLVLPADRFIVRQFSPVTTIGGGAVLDVLARRPTGRDVGRVRFLETLGRGDRVETLAAMTERTPAGLALEEIVARTGWLKNEVRDLARKLAASGRAKSVAEEPLILVPAKAYEEVRQ